MAYENLGNLTVHAQLNRMRLMLTSLFLGATLAACSTTPAEQCPHVDWLALGEDDGRQGFGPDRLDRHRSACSDAGVSPDAEAWEAGRSQGLTFYCQLPNAIKQGLARHAYAQTCADHAFEEIYVAARRLGDARYAVDAVDRDPDSRERRLLEARKLSDEERAEIRQLERRRDRLRDEQRDAERSLERLRDRVGV